MVTERLHNGQELARLQERKAARAEVIRERAERLGAQSDVAVEAPGALEVEGHQISRRRTCRRSRPPRQGAPPLRGDPSRRSLWAVDPQAPRWDRHPRSPERA